MEATDRQRRLLELCAIRAGRQGVDWNLIARQVQDAGGLDELSQGIITEQSAAAKRSLPVLRKGLRDMGPAADRVAAELDASAQVGARLVTVLDADYPANLRLIPDLPPFLFYRGDLVDDDVRSVAVVGTRQASEAGLCRAAHMSRLLARQQVTVGSGLARGCDTAAHAAALEEGGRTIAVLGTGITRCYPPENCDLAEAITGSGALVSQFWPTAPPTRASFPTRNAVTSGISQGSVVIEASSTSGAKMQARLALGHGKKVFLVHSLVTAQPWAQDYVDNRGAIEVASAEEVIAQLAPIERVLRAARQQQQLALAYL